MGTSNMRYMNNMNKQIKQLSGQIENMEKLIKLLLVNSLIDEMDITAKEAENEITYVPTKEVKALIQERELEYDGCKMLNGIQAMMLKLPKEKKLSASNVKEMCQLIRDSDSEIEPVFVYENLACQHRKIIVEAGVSFAVEGKELHLKKQEK